ncbi:prolipoprotein diacylglyceryl transferase [Gordonia sp. 'Campus']|uniref:prolipoprotein diacylglyceryl transferase n=1 Tax=Gordonia sp. 'Campus' TaxID=2915824 RepID=UPI001FD9E472
MLAYLPSPPQGVWDIGPFPLRAYALCIIAGIIVAVWWGNRRWIARGGQDGEVLDVAIWAVPFGLLGGRLYHLITDWKTYFGSDALKEPIDALKIWDGGLGIWGAVALGAVGAWIGARRHGIRLPAFGDAIAPPILLAQAIGRLGNYFNQELYGRETTLPWGLEIFERENAAGYSDPGLIDGVSNGVVVAVVHPTFLYELLWNVLIVVLLVAVDRFFRIGHGRLFALYVAGYCLGRFFVELLRDDRAAVANDIAGIRPNLFTAALVFLGAIIYFVVATKGREQGLEMYHDDRAAELEEQGVAGYVDDWYDEDLEPDRSESKVTAAAAAGTAATAGVGSSLFDDDSDSDDSKSDDNKSDDNKSDDSKTGDSESDDNRADEPGSDDSTTTEGETADGEVTDGVADKSASVDPVETADPAGTGVGSEREAESGSDSVGEDDNAPADAGTADADDAGVTDSTDAEPTDADPTDADSADVDRTDVVPAEGTAAEGEASGDEVAGDEVTGDDVTGDDDAAEDEGAASDTAVSDPEVTDVTEAATEPEPEPEAESDASTDSDSASNSVDAAESLDSNSDDAAEPADPTPGEDGPAGDRAQS